MFDENGLGNHRTYTTGASDAENGGDEMDEENNQIAHGHMVQGENKGGFWQNLRIRHQQLVKRPLSKWESSFWKRFDEASVLTIPGYVLSCAAFFASFLAFLG